MRYWAISVCAVLTCLLTYFAWLGPAGIKYEYEASFRASLNFDYYSADQAEDTLKDAFSKEGISLERYNVNFADIRNLHSSPFKREIVVNWHESKFPTYITCFPSRYTRHDECLKSGDLKRVVTHLDNANGITLLEVKPPLE